MTPQSAKLGWLHLTDLHVGTEQDYLWPEVEEHLLDDLPRLHKLTGDWRFVFFTGDLVQSGRPDQYDQFEKIRKRFMAKISDLQDEPIWLAVPGNHDLIRPGPHSLLPFAAKSWQSEESIRDAFWSKDSKHELRIGVAEAFANWSSWWDSNEPQQAIAFRRGLLPGDYSATFVLPEVKVGVVALNSTFLQLDGTDFEGRLALSKRQLADVCPAAGGGTKWAREHDVTFLLTHQPPGWLDGDSRKELEELAPPARFSVHLFGHEHEPHATVRAEFGGEDRFEVLGQSLFGLESFTDHKNQRQVQREHGYSAGQVTIYSNSLGVRLWPRKGKRLRDGTWEIRKDDAWKLQPDEATRERVIARPGRSLPKRPAGRRRRTAQVPIADTERRYRDHALRMWDIIDLANLPEDRELATKQLDLRRLYVPLRLRAESEPHTELGAPQFAALEERRAADRVQARQMRRSEEFEDAARIPVGKCLGRGRRVVVLGDPGAGKTTLLRWIATAYLLRLTSDPDLGRLPDETTLPTDDWLPVIIRCRDLKGARMPDLTAMLRHTLRRDEFIETQNDPMVRLLVDRLRNGRALLLVDGLDEISGLHGRKAFCEQLSRIARAYPKIPIVVTSRVVGYREIGRPLWHTFEHFTVADLSRTDKIEFARRWIALTESESRRREATRDLIRDIHSADRIAQLTANPMLLTTLALVKRQVGTLPRRRAELYSSAVNVLLTWRSEMGKTLDQREALPQLEYLAYAMCEQGVQHLSEDKTLELLSEMRREYGDRIHTLKRHTPEDFLQLVERQTEILVQAGHEKEGGRLVPVFEFRHLSFQEYLAGKALVEGRYPGRDREKTLADRVAEIALRATSPTDGAGGDSVEAAELWREALRLCSVSSPDDQVDGVLKAILTPSAPETVLPRAVLAALCLADDPNASEATGVTVLKALVDHDVHQTGAWQSARWIPDWPNTEQAVRELASSHWSARMMALVSERFQEPTATRERLVHLARVAATLSNAVAIDGDKFEHWQHACVDHLSSDDTDAIGAALSVGGLEPWVRCLVDSTLISALSEALTRSDRYALAATWALASLAGQERNSPWRDPRTPTSLLLAAVKPLMDVLAGGSEEVKQSAAEALGGLGDPRAVKPLIEALSTASEEVKQSAAEALGGLGDPRAVKPLIDALSTGSEEVKLSAAEALGGLGDPRAVKPLIDALSTGSEEVKLSAAEALGGLGDPRAVKPLIDALSTGSEEVKWHAARALLRCGDARAVKPLIDALSTGSEEVKLSAVGALGSLGDARAVKPLIDALSTGSEEVKQWAAEALGSLGDVRAVKPMIEALSTGSEEVKQWAVGALGSLGDARAVKPMIEALSTGSEEVKQSAAEALGGLGDPRAVKPLIDALSTGSEGVKWHAARALLCLADVPQLSLVQDVLSARDCLELIDMRNVEVSDRCVALASSIAPTDPEVLAFRGEYFEVAKLDYDEADKCFERALEAHVDSEASTARLRSRYATILIRRGDEERARAYCADALEEAPDDPFVLARYGSLLLRVGEHNQQAELAFLRSFSSGGTNPGALADYALLLEDRGEVTAAQKCLQAALEQDRELNRFSIWLSAAAFHFRHQENDRAQALVRPDIRPLIGLALAFLRYIHVPVKHHELLIQIRAALEAGERVRLPYLPSNVSAALRQGHPSPKLVVALGSVLADGEPADRLEAFEEWNEAVP